MYLHVSSRRLWCCSCVCVCNQLNLWQHCCSCSSCLVACALCLNLIHNIKTTDVMSYKNSFLLFEAMLMIDIDLKLNMSCWSLFVDTPVCGFEVLCAQIVEKTDNCIATTYKTHCLPSEYIRWSELSAVFPFLCFSSIISVGDALLLLF